MRALHSTANDFPPICVSPDYAKPGITIENRIGYSVSTVHWLYDSGEMPEGAAEIRLQPRLY